IETTTFDKNRFEFQADYFDDPNCTAPSSTLEADQLSGTFAIGAPVATSSGVEAKALDLKVGSANGTAANVTVFNMFYLGQGGLFVGDEGGETPESRPSTLDFDSPMTRQGGPGAVDQPGSGTDSPET